MMPSKLIFIETINDINGVSYCFYRADLNAYYGAILGEIPINGPIIIEAYGQKVTMYFKNGYLHREDGPAIEGAMNRPFPTRFYFKGLPVTILDLLEMQIDTKNAPSLMAYILGNKKYD